ncbi:MAG: hypothetical protein KJ767_01950 [Nanoarchaeota archaeon]|nr:hypothetical protein [Nanoarchaeota archaeon]
MTNPSGGAGWEGPGFPPGQGAGSGMGGSPNPLGCLLVLMIGMGLLGVLGEKAYEGGKKEYIRRKNTVVIKDVEQTLEKKLDNVSCNIHDYKKENWNKYIEKEWEEQRELDEIRSKYKKDYKKHTYFLEYGRAESAWYDMVEDFKDENAINTGIKVEKGKKYFIHADFDNLVFPPYTSNYDISLRIGENGEWDSISSRNRFGWDGGFIRYRKLDVRTTNSKGFGFIMIPDKTGELEFCPCIIDNPKGNKIKGSILLTIKEIDTKYVHNTDYVPYH